MEREVAQDRQAFHDELKVVLIGIKRLKTSNDDEYISDLKIITNLLQTSKIGAKNHFEHVYETLMSNIHFH